MVLINEAHHRIKNNLQLIAAMLYMQARRNSGVPDVYSTLMQAGHRVRAVAQLHDRLQHDAGCDVDAGEYLHDLCANLSRSLGLSTSRAVVVKSPLVLLQADCMLRLGMIVTELVTNAAKHGITPSGTCHIRVVLTPTHHDTFRLLVSDTGPGIPDIASCGTHGSLGLVLVRHLTDAIGGRFEIDGTPPGARFIIRFPQGGKARRKGDAEGSSDPWA
jgi:two-component sensor histidine kinase